MSENDELKKYLRNNPWPEEYYGRTQIDYFYNYNLDMAPHELWPLISDTSEVNRILGLEKMSFEERNGKLYAKGKLAFFQHEWEEIPWEWEAPVEMKTSRIYSKGVIEYVRAHYILSDTGNNTTGLTIYLGWVPKNTAGYIILKTAKNVIKKKFRKVISEFQSRHDRRIIFNVSEGLEKYAISNTSEVYRTNEEKFNPIRDYLTDHGIEASLVYLLINYIINSTDDKLDRIKPKVLSETLGVELEKLISVLLHSCKCGLLNLSWDIVCPHCRGVREKHPHLWSIESKATCEVCDIDFSTGGMNIIEVTFSVNPGIRKVEKVLYCSAEPAKKPHILLQKNLYRGGTYTFTIPELEKRLRFRTKGKKSYGILDVETKARKNNFYWDDLNSSVVLKCSPGSTVFINNTEKEVEQYIIEVSDDDQYALRPADLFNFNEFREIFSDETLAYGISIDIGMQNILFIDIVGSTEYYKNVGDTEAFKTIRKYFVKVNEIAKKYNGVIVKTIGDAVMLSFPDPLQALRCSIKLISAFDGSDVEVPLCTRISINRGSCLAVNLDTLIDYFGQTVNVASKLQTFTDSGEISLTEEFTNEPSVSGYLREKNYTFKNINRAEIKGAGEVLFSKIRIKKLPK
jgi:hypothetical protein